MLQIVSQSAVLFDAWQRRNRFKVAYDFLDCHTEIIGRIGSPIGDGLGQWVAVKLPKKEGPLASETRTSFYRNANRPRDFMASPGTMLINSSHRFFDASPDQVALQLFSAVRYVTSMAHVMWDLHEDDLLVEPATPHLTILDIFMLPD
ncbi:unnamed protein product, partial [Symbiodinium microadriaticum]